MTPSRLNAASVGGNFGNEPEPKRQAWARLLSRTLFGKVAALARVTGYSERMWQHFIEPQSAYESPFEEVVEATLGMRRIGAESPDAQFAEAARQLGFELAPIVAVRAWPDATVAEQSVVVHKELSDATDAAIRAARAGDVDEFRVQYDEAVRSLQALGQMVLGDAADA